MIKLQAQSACRAWFAARKVNSVEDRSRDSLQGPVVRNREG